DDMRGDRHPGMRNVEEVHGSIGPSGKARWRDIAPMSAAVCRDEDGVVSLVAVLTRRSDGPAAKGRDHFEWSAGIGRADLDWPNWHAQAGCIGEVRTQRGRGGHGRR